MTTDGDGTARQVIGFAHRGARAHARENTLEAFELALAMGARGLESDAWLTRDGVVVLDHDGVFDGRPIAELPRSELPDFVPSLEELYTRCGADFELSVDVKDEAAALPMIALAERRGDPGRLWLCHWSWRRVAEWRTRSADVRLVDSTRVAVMRTPAPERAARMRRLGIDALNLHESDWSEDRVEAMHAEGRACFAWDTQVPETLDRALARGIDAIYSDHVDRMQQALARRARGPTA